ncbi:hypothetical protein SCP_1700450 [Sparassis crispa]|uniref:Non-specific serine/threonine protein kinase n=1 Tax=Sparassis crispa TaxID=139825 RepID=A0A401H5P6_9APHY|nr:hypothetical protein SCP_1700450 [Sparassis crispa]GBE89721.1 hypothetical protein SCP_1700450 [Sparassis crispa]
MSTLRFPDQHSYTSPKPTYELARYDDANSNLQLAATNTLRIHHGHSVIYTATLQIPNQPAQAVICKVVLGKRGVARLRNEVDMYWRIAELQGDVVPRCFGLFEGELEDGPSACLVLQDCGERLYKEFFATSWTFRYDLIIAMSKIHNAGVAHRDFAPRNIVVSNDNKPFIIDFDRAKKHDCYAATDIIFNTPEPREMRDQCQELWLACKSVDVWKPRSLRYMGYFVPLEYADTPEMLATRAPEGTPEEEALKQARLSIAIHKERMRLRAHCLYYS